MGNEVQPERDVQDTAILQEQKISSADELRERAAAATERYHAMGDSIKAAEARLTEIAVLKTHIINYAKTREVYAAYRKAGYSKAFLEAHREEITLHKAAKAAFDESNLKTLPKVKELDAEFAELLTQKKAAYPDYRKARNEMQELVRAQKNVERFLRKKKQYRRTSKFDKKRLPRVDRKRSALGNLFSLTQSLTEWFVSFDCVCWCDQQVSYGV